MFKEKIYKRSNIILTSPHTTYTFREVNGKWVLHKKEKYVEEMLKYLSKKNKWSFLCYADHFCIDPNFHSICFKSSEPFFHPFKEKLLRIMEKINLSYLFDIHGMKDEYGIDICIGTNIDLGKDFLKKMKLICKGKKITVNYPFSGRKSETIAKFANALGLKSFQIELSLKFREDKSNWDLLEKVIKALSLR